MSNKTRQVKTHPGVKIQPPLLMIVHIAIAFGLQWWIPLPLAVPPILRTIGFLLVVVGFMLGLAALHAFRRTRVTRTPRGNQPLITASVYRFTRNPIYLGFLLMLAGIPLNAGSYWGIFLAPIMVFLFNRLVIVPEEKVLEQRFGAEYSDYRARVRRWV